MMENVRNWLRRPGATISDEREKRNFHLIQLILLTQLGFALFRMVFSLIQPQQHSYRLAVNAIMTVFSLVLLFRLRRGHTREVVRIALYGVWLFLTIVNITNGGVLAPSYSSYIVIAMCAGLLIGPRVGFNIALASAVTGLLLVLAARAGLLPTPSGPNAQTDYWVNQILLMFMVVLIITAADRIIGDTLKRGEEELRARRRAEVELLKSQNKYLTLFEASSDAIMMLDRNHFIDCNEATLFMFGIADRDEFRRHSSASLSPPVQANGGDSYTEADKRIAEAFQHGTCKFEWLHRRSDGSVFPAEVWLTVLPLAGPRMLQATVRDISARYRMEEELRLAKEELERRVAERTWELQHTNALLEQELSERQRAEEALRRSERQVRSMIENMQDVFYRADMQGNLIMISPSGARLLGYDSPAEMLGKNIARDFYAVPEEREKFLTLLAKQGYVRNLETTLRARDGTNHVVWTSSQYFRDADGTIIGVEGTVRDVTEQRQLEGQIRQLQKMEVIGQLAGGIAHDFNNVLTAVVGYGDILKNRLDSSSPLRPLVEMILAAAQRAAGMTQRLLAFSRKQVMTLRPVNLNDVMHKLEKLLTRLIREDIEMHVHTHEAPLTVLADSGQIDQVIMNLVTNARDAMPNGGVLTIHTGVKEFGGDEEVQTPGLQPGRFATLTIRDNGCGMDERVRERIFEPFFTTKEAGKGTGLGLAMVYGIVQQHKGFVTVASEPGKGSAFTIHLPLVPHQAEESEWRPEIPAAGGKETLLVAEDDLHIRNLLRQILEEYGYRVFLAADGDEAVELHQTHSGSIDMVILDLIMPKRNGWDAFMRMRDLTPELKVLFLSGYTDHKTAQEIARGGWPLQQKPITVDVLLRAVRDVLGATSSPT